MENFRVIENSCMNCENLCWIRLTSGCSLDKKTFSEKAASKHHIMAVQCTCDRFKKRSE